MCADALAAVRTLQGSRPEHAHRCAQPILTAVRPKSCQCGRAHPHHCHHKLCSLSEYERQALEPPKQDEDLRRLLTGVILGYLVRGPALRAVCPDSHRTSAHVTLTSRRVLSANVRPSDRPASRMDC